MDLVLVNIFEVAIVRCPQDGVGDIFSDNLGDPFCNPLLDNDCCEAENVLSVSFVLGVTVVCNLRLDGAIVGADDIGSCS